MASWIVPSFGATGGGFGGMGNVAEYANRAMSRLLSPDEFAQLDDETRSAFGTYMSYLQTYARRGKAKQEAQSVFQQLKAGTYQPPEIAFDNSAFRQANAQQAAKRVPAPSAGTGETRLRKDISGTPRLELSGQGIRRRMGGDIFLQTPEQVGRQRRVDYAVPAANLDADIELLGKRKQKVDIEDAIAYPKRREAQERMAQGATRLAQSGERIKQGQQRLEDTNTRFKVTLKQQDYLKRLDDELQKERMKLQQGYKVESREDQQKFDEAMTVLRGQVPGTPQSMLRHQEAAEQAITVLERSAEIAKNTEERELAQKKADEIRAFQFWLEKKRVESYTAPAGGWDQRSEIEVKQDAIEKETAKQARESGFVEMDLDEFVARFTKQEGRPPSSREISKARGKYWI